MDMSKQIIVAASAYTEKYFINPDFKEIPNLVIEDLRKIAVNFVNDVGGEFSIGFYEDGEVFLEAKAAEEDILYDEIGSQLNLRRIEREYGELLENLTKWYELVFKQTKGE